MAAKKRRAYFTPFELILWFSSVLLIVLSFAFLDGENYLYLSASLIGVTSLIFCAKGNPAGQVLMIIFSIIYGIISYGFGYYGEMITYLGMTMPMAVFSLISWLKNPYNGSRSQVRINKTGIKEKLLLLLPLSIAVTIVFYFILRHFNTPNLIPCTLSVLTSFTAAYLTLRRSPYYAAAYALNDLVLIYLWWLAGLDDTRYISVTVCFTAFFANDIYGFISWKKLEKTQNKEKNI